MCVIIDTNRIGDYINQDNEDLKPLRQRVEKNKIKLIFPPLGSGLQGEYQKLNKFWKLFPKYRKKGLVKVVSEVKIERAEHDLRAKERQGKISFQSNQQDFSILVLAKASGTKLLVSNDINLGKDFTNSKIIGGNIYKTKRNKNLLDSNKCPS